MREDHEKRSSGLMADMLADQEQAEARSRIRGGLFGAVSALGLALLALLKDSRESGAAFFWIGLGSLAVIVGIYWSVRLYRDGQRVKRGETA